MATTASLPHWTKPRFPAATLRRFYAGRLAALPSLPRFDSPAVVFAPHPDDESLGCGGTLLRKTDAGAPLWLVFMTDGATSHSHLMDPKELRRLRKLEAQAAAEVLGVLPDRVLFFDYPDGRLTQHIKPAVERVRALLREVSPQEVFIPYQYDAQPDHLATHALVSQAVHLEKQSLEIIEYPVWFWYHWPWVRLIQHSKRDLRAVLTNTVRTLAGLQTLVGFNSAVDVSGVLDRKQEALHQHRSQTSVLIPQAGWATLADVSAGDFLACFFTGYEVFRRYRLEGSRNIGGTEETLS